MKRVTRRCHAQVWVCVNERDPQASPLPSCGVGAGHALYEALQKALLPWAQSKGLVLWVNRSLCQGFCDVGGVTCTLEPSGRRWQGVSPQDTQAIIEEIKSILS